jgi:hypothetical protein
LKNGSVKKLKFAHYTKLIQSKQFIRPPALACAISSKTLGAEFGRLENNPGSQQDDKSVNQRKCACYRSPRPCISTTLTIYKTTAGAAIFRTKHRHLSLEIRVRTGGGGGGREGNGGLAFAANQQKG